MVTFLDKHEAKLRQPLTFIIAVKLLTDDKLLIGRSYSKCFSIKVLDRPERHESKTHPSIIRILNNILIL